MFEISSNLILKPGTGRRCRQLGHGATTLTTCTPLAAIKSEQNLQGFYQRQSQMTTQPPAGARQTCDDFHLSLS